MVNTQALDAHTVVLVWPDGRVYVNAMRLECVTAAGTRYHVAESRWYFRSWAEALRRRKPWRQPGPLLVVPFAYDYEE